MKVKLYTNTEPKLGDKLIVSFVDTTMTGEHIIMAKVEEK